MSYNLVDGIPVYGVVEDKAIQQLKNCLKFDEIIGGALMGDAHLGFSMPIGGVAASETHISPVFCGVDIACGNEAVKITAKGKDVIPNIKSIMDDVWKDISFGTGGSNKQKAEHELFDKDNSIWNTDLLMGLKRKASQQFGTIGSGNHYVDIFVDENDDVWVGVHFGSRGLGHTVAEHYMKIIGQSQNMDSEPVLLSVKSDLGQEYLHAMELCGQYAYAGREWVCDYVAKNILKVDICERIHNHHNFAWKENHFGKDVWVVRKGATPAFPGQKGFVGGSMGDNSVILEGVDSEESKIVMYSTVHGAGRVMSRTQATGLSKYSRKKKFEPGVTQDAMNEWVSRVGIELRGADVDEAPQCYKRLDEVLVHHSNTVKILHVLRPIGVAMAGYEGNPEQ